MLIVVAKVSVTVLVKLRACLLRRQEAVMRRVMVIQSRVLVLVLRVVEMLVEMVMLAANRTVGIGKLTLAVKGIRIPEVGAVIERTVLRNLKGAVFEGTTIIMRHKYVVLRTIDILWCRRRR